MRTVTTQYEVMKWLIGLQTDRFGNPTCSRIVRALPGNRPSRTTALTVHENLNLMATGFENGSVLLFKGDVTRERLETKGGKEEEMRGRG